MRLNQIAASLLVAAACLPAVSTAANEQTAARGTEYVYVESNLKPANSNSLFGYRREADGSLTELPGSPFLTGGAGIQYSGVNAGPIDSDDVIITNPEQTLLFTVNSGSDTVAVMRIQRDGSLVPVPGSPFPSGGQNPVGLALNGNMLFVVNKSGDFGRPTTILPNYTILRVERDGTLSSLGSDTNDSTRYFNATVSVAQNSSPTQALLIPGTNLMYGADFLGGLLQIFQYDWNRGLHPLPPLALPAAEFAGSPAPRWPLGLWNHPRLPILYVGYVTNAKLGVYRIGPLGGLSFVRAVPNSGRGICWLRTNRAGTLLYTSNTGSNTVSVYDLADPENPVEIQSLLLKGIGNVLHFSLSRDGRNLYALTTRGTLTIPDGTGNSLHALTINDDGSLSENGEPIIYNLPLGVLPQGVAVARPRN